MNNGNYIISFLGTALKSHSLIGIFITNYIYTACQIHDPQ